MKNYILKTVNKDMTSCGGFKWKKKGVVRCPDWKPTKNCGNGLHGALNGVGDGYLFNWNKDAVWVVAEVDKGKGIDLGGKWKFPVCKVVFTGNQKQATDWLLKRVGDVPMIGCFKVGGDHATVSGGDYARVSGGDYARVSGGDRAKVSGGDRTTVSGGGYAKVSGGDEATVSGGDEATVSGGDEATVSGGYGAILQLKFYDGERYRVAVGYVGEDGIRPNVQYRVNSYGKFIKS